MANATSKASSVTTLVIGKVEVPVALSTTVAKPAAIKDLFTTAGPNGGVLKARQVARPVEDLPDDVPPEPTHSDPLMVETLAAPASEPDPLGPGPGMERDVWDEPVRAFVPPVEREANGEYSRELYEEGTGEVVPPEKIRRGVRLDDGRFIDCTAQLAEIDENTRLERMEVVPDGFVDITQVSRARVKGCYYIGTDDPAARHALALLREGLKATRRGAVVKLTKRSRQSLGLVGWLGSSLVLYELVFAEDFREPPARARLTDETVAPGELEAFCQLVEAWSGPVTVLDSLRDDAIGKREELYRRALAGEIADVVDAEVIDPAQELSEQLAASLAAVSA